MMLLLKDLLTFYYLKCFLYKFLLHLFGSRNLEMQTTANEEMWKVIPSFPDYEASTLGNVRNKKTMKVISFHENYGYMTSHLYTNKKRCPVKAHRLIAETFIENPDNKECVNHKDKNRSNNNVFNLEWTTIKENNDHKLQTNFTYQKTFTRAVWMCDKDTKQKLRKFKDANEAALFINSEKKQVVSNKIRCVANGERLSTYGFYWEYESYPTIEGEIWKDITFLPEANVYEISSEGRLRNNKGTMFFGHKDDNGYIRVCINEKLYRMHILVAKAFLPNPEDKPHVNHKDGVRDNNKLENLEWVTRSENMQHAYDTGLNQRRKKTIS